MSQTSLRRQGRPDERARAAADQQNTRSTARERRARGFDLLAHGFAELAAAEREGARRDVYGTKAGFEPPEFVGRHREWVAVCRTMRGAYRLRPDSRWWWIGAADYERSRGNVEPETVSSANDAEPWSPALAMAAIGRRATR